MGIATQFAADDEVLLNTALAAFAVWRGMPRVEHGEPLRIWLVAGEEPGPGDRAPEIHVDGGTLRLTGPGIRGEARVDRGEASCTVPRDLFGDPERLAAQLLDTLVLFLLTRSGRVPLHAAGLLIGETAVLLAGPSGSGKSTLAHAALRDGIQVLSEDTVYLQHEPRVRVWGFPRPIHLLPERIEPAGARNGTAGFLRRRGGRWKVAVPAEQHWPNGPTAENAMLCLLERGQRVALRPIAAAAASHDVLASLEPGFDHFRHQLPPALAALTAAGGAWRLTLSSDPLQAIATLRAALAS